MISYIPFISDNFNQVFIGQHLLELSNNNFSGIKMEQNSLQEKESFFTIIKGVFHGLAYIAQDNCYLCYTNNQYNGYLISASHDSINYEILDHGIPIENGVFFKDEYSQWEYSLGEDQDKVELILKDESSKLIFDDIYNAALDEALSSSRKKSDNPYSEFIAAQHYLNISMPFEGEEVYRYYWAYGRKLKIENGDYSNIKDDFLPYYYSQKELSKRVINTNHISAAVKYIAAADIAFDQLDLSLAATFIILDVATLEVIEIATYKEAVSYSFMPELHSFYESTILMKAYKKISIKPDLIICNAQGQAHLQKIGTASHIGLALDIPTIGCTSKRLVGFYDRGNLKTEKGCNENLLLGGEIIGKVLRTKKDENPLFVSIGHKISLESACDWILNLCNEERLPITHKISDQLIHQMIHKRTVINLMNDELEE